MNQCLSTIILGSNFITRVMDFLAPWFALGIRCHMAYVFFWAGWLKLQSWTSTLYLFTHEYKIVGISPVAAAYIGTTLELTLPVFLLLGFGARLPALAAIILNCAMLCFYPILTTPEGTCMAKDHYLWAALTAFLLFYGHGKWSVDHLVQQKCCPKYRY